MLGRPVNEGQIGVLQPEVALPLIMIPLLRAGNDRQLMGAHVNGRLARTVAGLNLALVTVVAVAAVPLLIVTGGS